MNIKNLKRYIKSNGNKVKNYPTLCGILEIKQVTSNSKEAQFKELERFVKYEQTGHKFIIKEIFNKPKPKNDNRGKQGKYTDLVQLLLTDFLVEQQRQVVTITLNKALKILRLINHNYSYCSNNILRFSNYIGVEEQITYDHFMLTSNNFKRVFERALDNLEDMSLIEVYKDAVFITDTDNQVHLANNDEVELFRECGEIALNEIFGDKKRSERKMSNVRYTKYWNKYKRISNKLFKENMSDDQYGNKKIKKVFIGYRIIVNRNAIKQAHNELLIEYLDQAKRKERLNEMESFVLSDLMEKVIKRQVDARNIKNKNVSKRMREYRMMFSYVDNSKKIIDIVHKQNAEDIKTKINEARKRELTKEDNNVINSVLSDEK